MSSFTAACLTLCSGRDPRKNRDVTVRLARDAIAQGADYIQTPEMTSLVERDREQFKSIVGSQDQDLTLTALRQLARDSQVIIHLGSIAIRHKNTYLNRSFLINRQGEIAAFYDKIHLFDVALSHHETYRESDTYGAGSEAVIAKTPVGVFGMSICYDLRFPALYRCLAEAGASILTAPSCFTKPTGEAHWHVLQRARAIETGSFIVSAAQSGLHEDGRETYGHSLIIDPWGRVLAESGIAQGVIMATIDTDLVAQTRQRIPALENARPFKLSVF